jgi:hypothetical protein
MTMPSIDLRLDGDGAFKDLADRPREEHTSFKMTGLKRGTAAGRPTLMLACELEDGRVVFLQTTLALMENSIGALKARWEMEP